MALEEMSLKSEQACFGEGGMDALTAQLDYRDQKTARKKDRSKHCSTDSYKCQRCMFNTHRLTRLDDAEKSAGGSQEKELN